MHWIVAGLIAGVGAFFADYVMWGKVFTGPDMHAFGTTPPTPAEQQKLMAANLPKSALLALIFGVLLAWFYHQLKAGLWAKGGGPLAGMSSRRCSGCAPSRSRPSAAAFGTTKCARSSRRRSGRGSCA